MRASCDKRPGVGEGPDRVGGDVVPVVLIKLYALGVTVGGDGERGRDVVRHDGAVDEGLALVSNAVNGRSRGGVRGDCEAKRESEEFHRFI
jgi:hypothetical protein